MTNPHDIVIRPIVTEQSMADMADKKYTFVVQKGANKTEIKKAVESIFGVDVEKVNTLNYDGKVKRMGRSIGKTASYKKAVVKFFIYTLAGSLFMLVAFVYMYQQAGSFLLEDLYKLNLTASEQKWIFWCSESLEEI